MCLRWRFNYVSVALLRVILTALHVLPPVKLALITSCACCQPSLMDLATTLIIIASNGDSRANSAMSTWLLTPNMFPFTHLEAIINKRAENEVSFFNGLSNVKFG